MRDSHFKNLEFEDWFSKVKEMLKELSHVVIEFAALDKIERRKKENFTRKTLHAAVMTTKRQRPLPGRTGTRQGEEKI